MSISTYIVEGPGAPMGSISAYAIADLFHTGKLSVMRVRLSDSDRFLSDEEIRAVVASVQMPPQMSYAPAQQIQDGNQDPMRFVAPIHASGWAVASGYLGLFSVLLIFAPFSVLTGVLALKDLKKNAHKTGKGRAIFGIAMGVGSMVFWGLILLANMR